MKILFVVPDIKNVSSKVRRKAKIFENHGDEVTIEEPPIYPSGHRHNFMFVDELKEPKNDRGRDY